MPRSVVAMFGVALGTLSALSAMTYYRPKDLHSATIYGNAEAVRRIVSTSAMCDLDLNRALRISAGLGRLDIAEMLVKHGATDMAGALNRAASQNKMNVVRWLVAPERIPLDSDLDLAIKCAGNSGAAEAEFFLLTTRRHYRD